MLTPWTCPQCGRAAQVSRFPVRCSCGRSSLADGTSLAQAPRVPAAQIGPGAVLHELLAGWGVTAQAGCGCEDMAARMNAWGVEGCRERVDEIAGWLVAEAVRRDWPLARWRIGGVLMAAAARGLVRRAIRTAEKRTFPRQ